MNKLKSS